MKRQLFVLVAVAASTILFAQTDSLSLQEVVVTGTRNAVDVRHLPYTVNVINRLTLTEQQQSSVLPTVMQQVPGLMVTSRSMTGSTVYRRERQAASACAVYQAVQARCWCLSTGIHSIMESMGIPSATVIRR